VGETELAHLKAIVTPKLMEAVDVMNGLAQDLNQNEDGARDTL
jgi:hypothetical protein